MLRDVAAVMGLQAGNTTAFDAVAPEGEPLDIHTDNNLSNTAYRNLNGASLHETRLSGGLSMLKGAVDRIRAEKDRTENDRAENDRT